MRLHQELTQLQLPEGIDDLLVAPLRTLEIQSKVRGASERSKCARLRTLLQDMNQVTRYLEQDLEVLESIQLAHRPRRFTNLSGLEVTHRYFAGLRGGGDHLDFAERVRGKGSQPEVLMLLTDSSSYGLASTMLGLLMKATVEAAKSLERTVPETLSGIAAGLGTLMRPQDRLGVLCGSFRFSTTSGFGVLEYSLLGAMQLFLRRTSGNVSELSAHGAELGPEDLTLVQSRLRVSKLELQPGDQLYVFSDGVRESLGPVNLEPAALQTIGDKCSWDKDRVLNELSSRLRLDPDGFPNQDTTLAVVEWTGLQPIHGPF
jgi:serine phosphatase RsbU (regulator of sigma subunit)